MTVSDMREVAMFLISPEDSQEKGIMGDCRRFRDCPVRFAADRLKRVAIAASQTRAASSMKTLLWLGLAIGTGMGLGQLQ